jgi:acyl-CoA thioester hydrolase
MADRPASEGSREVRRAWTRRDFPVLLGLPTRWADNDMYGHLNNAVYYELFDTAVNGWLAAQSGIDAASTPELGVVAESGCTFHREIGFPEPVTVGLRVERLGRSSVTYALGVFAGMPQDAGAGADATTVAAVGHWVHVYVDRSTRRATAMPAAVREVLQSIVTTEPSANDGEG